MTKISATQIIHKGVVPAAAFLFDLDLLGEPEARRRALALWKPGARVYQFGRVLVVALAKPQDTVCVQAPGLPLVEVEKRLVSFPVREKELKELAVPAQHVVYLRNHTLVTLGLTGDGLVDPSTWLDLSSVALVGTVSLGPPPAAPRLVAEAQSFDARAKLAGVPPEDPERAAIIAELLKSKEKKPETAAPHKPAQPAQSGPAGESLGSMFDNLTSSISNAVSSWFGSGSKSGGEPGSSVFSRLSEQFRQLAQKVVMATRLAQYIGQRQAEYLADLMNRFEDGDLDEALRRAIPLSNMPDSLKSVPSFDISFKPRADLSINPARSTGSASLSVGSDTFSYLRHLYRTAFDRLVAQGKIEEAAFVLAELLLENEEAVAFLERHGKQRLAAEMAEARGLPPGLVVRQWFLAGDVKRAVALARRYGAFADAILRLEAKNPDMAEKLRLIWAGVQAEAGDFALAVETIWPIQSARNLAKTWIDQGIEVGGVGSAQLLVRKLELVPESFAEVRPKFLEIWNSEEKETVFQRQTLTDRLMLGEVTPVKRTLARAAVRSVARDATNGLLQVSNETLDRYAVFTGDSVLRADLPKLPATTAPIRLNALREPLRIEFDATDVGNLGATDTAVLPDGSLLVALGEAGLRRLSRNGKTIRQYDFPTHSLIVSDVGNRVLALGRRGEAQRLTRIELPSGKAEDWCDAEFHTWAKSFDGSMWFVGHRDEVMAIDATARKFEALWRVPEVGRTLSLARSQKKLALVSGTQLWKRGDYLELFNYAFPHLILRNRDTTNQYAFECDNRLISVAPDGYIADLGFSKVGQDTIPNLWLRLWFCRTKEQGVELETGICTPHKLEITDHWIAIALKTIQGMEIQLLDVSEFRKRLVLVLAETKDISLTFQAEHLCLADDRGRVVVLNLNNGELLRNVRISV